MVTSGLALAIASGCYRPMQPACGFICGPAAACPDDYTCNSRDSRCHRNDTSPTMLCQRLIDAGPPHDMRVPRGEGGDTEDPTVVEKSPPNLSNNVSVGTTVIVVFSEDVINVNAATLFVEQDGTQVPARVHYDAGSDVATWIPSAQLAANTTFVAAVSQSIIDLSGNHLAGEAWVFTTGDDLVPPSVVLTSPFNGENSVAVDREVSVLFDEPVTNVTTTTFTLDQAGTPIPGAITMTMGARAAIFTASEQLPANTFLTATLTAAITDLAGNAVGGRLWSFTTGADQVPPSIVSITPASGTANVSRDATITVTFDEPVINVDTTTFLITGGAPIAGTVTPSNGGRSATFAPTSQLPASMTIMVMLDGGGPSGISDLTGNPLTGSTAFSFTTGP